MTSLADDVARLRQVLAWLDGPAVVVGPFLRRADHDRARRRHRERRRAGLRRRVRARRGRDDRGVGRRPPPPRALANVIVDEQGFGRLPEDDFVGHFAADVDPVKARVMHAAQQPVAMSVFDDVMGTPAWKSLPSWYLVAADDEAIAPDAERMFARRMGAETVEVASSHVPMVSHPDAVVELIEAAAKQAAHAQADQAATG